MATLEIYYSYRSPYSYLAVDRLVKIEREYAVDIDFRPVRPLALREPDFFERGRKQFVPYSLHDLSREAERLGVHFALPNPDPVDMDMTTGKVAPDQPLIDRLMALGVAAAALGQGLAFAQAISHAVWGGVSNWNEEVALREIVSAASLDFDAFAAWAASNPEQLQKTIERNEASQLEHHWGVPLMVLDGEAFFGQDRVESLIWRLDRLGLGAR